jgi:hypothetical protein
MGGLSLTEGDNLRKARDFLDKAGALTTENPGREMTDGVGDVLPAPPSDKAAFNMVRALGVVAVVLGKADHAHQCIMDMAHECLRELTNGTMCEVAAKVGARHSSETMEHLEAAHRHLVAAGATCDATSVSESDALPEETQTSDYTKSGKGPHLEDLTKALAVERADKTALGKVLGEIVPMLERLTQRVDDIARTPLPPLTIAKGTVSVSKQLDRGGASGGDPELSSETVASALAKMSKEEQTLTLIKASYANPIRVLGTGLASAEAMRRGDPRGGS